MTPFIFGSGKRRLFAIYTPAAPTGGRGRAVVLCPPWGDEYLRAHRPLRHLASQLAAAGVHVLRFDYFGTGDSAGDLRDADLAGWTQDIETALEELKDMTDARRVGLVGLRLGGTLAAAVAARQPGWVDTLVLWDPVVSGKAYLRELERDALPAVPLAAGSPKPCAELEIQGFPLTPAMALALQALDLAASAPGLAVPLRILVSEGEDACRRLRALLDGRTSHPVEVAHVPSPPCWIEDTHFHAGAVPVEALRRIVEWIR